MSYLYKILEASRYALLRDIYKSDPTMGLDTVAKIRECFRSNEPGYLSKKPR